MNKSPEQMFWMVYRRQQWNVSGLYDDGDE